MSMIKNNKDDHTGIVRNLDNLGRVVIPMEMRRTLGIEPGDPIEVSIRNGELCIRKVETTTDWHRTIKNLISQIKEVAFHDPYTKDDIIDHLDCVDALLTGETDDDLFDGNEEEVSNG